MVQVMVPVDDRDPRHMTLGREIRAARTRLGMSQSALGRELGTNQTHVSKDEAGFGVPDDRLQGYCKYFKWDLSMIRAFLAGPDEEPVLVRARREYRELMETVDTLLRDGAEQDLIEEAVQLVIMHRYPDVAVKDLA